MSPTAWAAWLGFALAGVLAIVFGGMLLIVRGFYLKAAPTIKGLAALQRGTLPVKVQATGSSSSNQPPTVTTSDLAAAGLVEEDK